MNNIIDPVPVKLLKSELTKSKKLEDKYIPYIPLKDRLDAVREVYGDQKDLLLMDNNVLASGGK